MVFHDPRNWAPDIQIALDVVRYGSATRSAFVRQENRPPESKSYREDPGPSGEGEMGLSGGKPVELVFCNPDLIWRGAYGRPRLGQGGFREAFQGIHTVRCYFSFPPCLLPHHFPCLSSPILLGSRGWAIPSHATRKADRSNLRSRGRYAR